MNENFTVSMEEFEDARKYWIEKLSCDFNEINLPYDYKKNQDYKKGIYKTAFKKELSEKILGMCKGQDILTYILSVAVFKVLLNKYTGENDIIIGSPIYTTSEEYYNNSKFIVLRDFVDAEATFRGLLASVKRTVIDGYKNQHYPMQKILDYLGVNSENLPMLKVIMFMESLHKKQLVSEITDSLANDMTISVSKAEQGMEWMVMYNTSLFKEDTMCRLAKHYFYIFEQVLSNINIKLSDIELVDSEERNQLLFEFNDTAVDYPMEKTVCEVFEEQVKKTPDSLAISSDNSNMTYKELNERANRLAWALREKGVKQNSIVGVMTNYTPEMVIAIMGVLKAGGAYLPIDPDYPMERINYMLEDSSANILITQKHLTSKVNVSQIYVICLEDSGVNEKSPSNLEMLNELEDLAYVIYTSGSTGKPKGTLIEHKSLLNFVNWRIRNYGITSRDRILQLISFSFDGFGANLYPTLLSGGTLVLPGDKHRGDFKYVNSIIKDKKVTNMSVVPAMYRAILESAQEDDLKTVRMVVLAGEKPDSGLVELSIKKNPGIILANEYGPTESCIAAVSFTGMQPQYTSVIGKPIANNRIFILDRNSNLMPVGVKGELCISGLGLARGYLNKPELTAEKFIQNPFSHEERMYRTGDTARWMPDGNIEFLGRTDQQVKIRGYRIELEEVEEAIKKYELIKEAVVMDKKDSSENVFLCAYLVSDRTIKVAELREFLSGILPEFMVPSRFIQLERIPLTKNGKLDRKGLPEPGNDVNTGEEYVEPKSDTETRLVEIWSKVLNANRIGVHDNFFDLGGNSILLMQVSSQIDKWIPGSITITDLFSYPTISKLADFLSKVQSEKCEAVQLKGLVLPSEYFSDESGYISLQFKFVISGSMLESIKGVSEKIDVEVQDILLSSYIYMFAKILKQETINVQVIPGKNNCILPVSVDLMGLENITDLLKLVKRNRQGAERDLYRINDISRIKVDRTGNSIIPLYSCESLSNNTRLLDIYDIIFESVEEYDKVCLEFHFNGGRLKENKMEELVGIYLKITRLLIDQCTLTEGEK